MDADEDPVGSVVAEAAKMLVSAVGVNGDLLDTVWWISWGGDGDAAVAACEVIGSVSRKRSATEPQRPAEPPRCASAVSRCDGRRADSHDLGIHQIA